MGFNLSVSDLQHIQIIGIPINIANSPTKINVNSNSFII